ncbi:helix-turn-helix domain-containing protein [Stenotrophomonas sp. NPDC087984]
MPWARGSIETGGFPPAPPRRSGSGLAVGSPVVGLRREEVAERAFISTDYYTRLEQRRGPRPSEQVTTALASALQLTADERDHLFALIGHNPPIRTTGIKQIDPALGLVLDSLDRGAAALVTSNIGQTLPQNPLTRALSGDQTQFTGLDRSGYYRWFARPEERDIYPADVHTTQSQTYAAGIRAAMDIGPDATEMTATGDSVAHRQRRVRRVVEPTLRAAVPTGPA